MISYVLRDFLLFVEYFTVYVPIVVFLLHVFEGHVFGHEVRSHT